MQFVNTIKAMKGQETQTWAVADGLVLDFKEANVDQPTTLHYKEAVEALKEQGFDYDPITLQDYWRVAVTFSGPKRRKAGATVKVYSEITKPLWSRLDPKTRHNDLVAYATQFFAENPPAKGKTHAGAYKARPWAKAQGAALDAERKAKLEAEAKKRAKEDLKAWEADLQGALDGGDEAAAKKALLEVNALRRRLGMELVEINSDTAEVTPDPVATEEASRETEEEKAERLHLEATSLWEKDSALSSMHIRRLGHTTRKVGDYFTEDDREAYAEELDTQIANLQLIRLAVAGSIADEELEKALADWSEA